MKTFIISLVSLVLIIVTFSSCEKDDFISAAQDPVDSRENLDNKIFVVKYIRIGTRINKNSTKMDFSNKKLITISTSYSFSPNYSGTNVTLNFVSNPEMDGTYQVLYTEMNQGLEELILKNSSNEFVLIK